MQTFCLYIKLIRTKPQIFLVISSNSPVVDKVDGMIVT